MDCRPSVGCGRRLTYPISSRAAITLVIEGGWTTSLAASSPGVIGPHFFRLDSAENWVNVTEVLVRCARSLRLSRTTASRNRLARERSSSAISLAYLTNYFAATSLVEDGLDRADGEVDDEGGGDDPEQRVDAAGPAGGRADQHVADEAGADAVGDRVRERHDHDGQEGRQPDAEVGEVDVLDLHHHQRAD